MKGQSSRFAAYLPGKAACRILLGGLPASLAVLLYIVLDLLFVSPAADPGIAGDCAEMMQYAFAGFSISVCGALLGDVLEKRSGKEKK